jgi:hypothetical protein
LEKQNKIFYSAEIRWFSEERDKLYSIYDSLNGISKPDPKRIDYYLNVVSENAGIKIREKKHEIKTKLVSDTEHPLGNLETWVKWSSKQVGSSILDFVDPALMNDWTAIEKNRFKKKYEVLQNGKVIPNNGNLNDGCGVEFTDLNIDGKEYFTFGLESFAFIDNKGNQNPDKVLPNLRLVLDYLKLSNQKLQDLDCSSYPKFLKRKFR